MEKQHGDQRGNDLCERRQYRCWFPCLHLCAWVVTEIPTRLVVTFDAKGRPHETRVPITGAELAAWQAEQAAAAARLAAENATQRSLRDELDQYQTQALALADLLDANNATAAQQRAGLSGCLRGLVRLSKVVYGELDSPA